MDPNIYSIGVPGLVILLGGFAWWKYQRDLTKQDESEKEALAKVDQEQSDYRKEVHESFVAQRQQIDSLRESLHAIELAMAKTMTQQDLNSLFTKMDALRTEVKTDLEKSSQRQDDLLGKVLLALGSKVAQ